ncbi:MAG: PilZ domain-containing protein [Acidobacteriaceae bacterium]
MRGANSKRIYERYPIDIRVTLSVFRAGVKHDFWGRTSDLGEKGIAATVTGNLEVGEIVSMRFVVLDAAFDATACVQYRRGCFCGFEFLKMSTEHLQQLKKTCEQLRSVSAAVTPEY